MGLRPVPSAIVHPPRCWPGSRCLLAVLEAGMGRHRSCVGVIVRRMSYHCPGQAVGRLPWRQAARHPHTRRVVIVQFTYLLAMPMRWWSTEDPFLQQREHARRYASLQRGSYGGPRCAHVGQLRQERTLILQSPLFQQFKGILRS